MIEDCRFDPTGVEVTHNQAVTFSPSERVGEHFVRDAVGKCGARVCVADRGREFAFATVRTPGGDDTNEDGMTRWGYTFTANEDGTEVEESWELTPSGRQTVNAMPEKRRDAIVESVMPNTLSGMEETPANLKRVAEAG